MPFGPEICLVWSLYCAHSSFHFSPTCSLLFVTVPNSSELFFFSKFQCNFTFVEKIIKFYNFVCCRVRHRFFLFRTSCDHDDEKLPLKYIVERTRFYVSLKLEKNSDELFGGKNYPIEIHGRANKLWPWHNWHKLGLDIGKSRVEWGNLRPQISNRYPEETAVRNWMKSTVVVHHNMIYCTDW